MAVGKKIWLIPDCELPHEGDGVLKGHESVIIVNDSDVDAIIDVKFILQIKSLMVILNGMLVQIV